jgi:hypothetical protein
LNAEALLGCSLVTSVVVGDGEVEALERLVRNGAAEIGRDMFGLQFHRPIVVCERALGPSLLEQRVAPVVVGEGVLRIEFDRDVVVGDGASSRPLPSFATPRLTKAS